MGKGGVEKAKGAKSEQSPQAFTIMLFILKTETFLPKKYNLLIDQLIVAPILCHNPIG